MNAGWLGFAAVEIAGATGLLRVFTPIMGISILVAIVTYALRLRAAEEPTRAPVPAAGRG